MPPEGELDGVLLIGASVDNTIEQLIQRRGMPVVLVDAYAPGAHYDAAVTDNLRGAYEAVTYLIRQGHRHIGMVLQLAGCLPKYRGVLVRLRAGAAFYRH